MIKSFGWNNKDSHLQYFLTEIVTYQIIQNKKELLSENADELLKCPYIAEYVGFILNDETSPYFGSIVIKWYSFGDLSHYVHKLSNPKWFAKRDESIDNVDNEYILDEKKQASMPKEIYQLVDLARQIAEGLNNQLNISFLF